MHYLFHTSNSINDFIDPTLSHILSRSQANEMGNQTISWGWQHSRFSLSKVPHKSHPSRFLLQCGATGSLPLAFGEEAGQLLSHPGYQKIWSVILTNSSGLLSTTAKHFHLVTRIYNLFGSRKTLTEIFHNLPLLRADDIRK